MDNYIVYFFSLLNVSIFLIAIVIALKSHFFSNGCRAESARGEQTMQKIHKTYFAVLALYTFVIKSNDNLDCYYFACTQLLLIISNAILLTYLFYFSSWFRNVLFLRIANYITKD